MGSPDGNNTGPIEVVDMPSVGASMYVLKYFLTADPGLTFSVVVDGCEYPLELNSRGDLLVNMGLHKVLVSGLRQKIFLTVESATKFRSLQAEQEAQVLRDEMDKSRAYIAESAFASMKTAKPDEHSNVRSLLLGLRMFADVEIMSLIRGVDISLRRPNKNLTQRLRKLVDALAEQGVSFHIQDDVSGGGGYPNRIIYFDSDGILKRVLLKFFQGMYGGGNRVKKVEDFFDSTEFKKVLVLHTSANPRESLSKDLMDRFTITTVDNFDKRK